MALLGGKGAGLARMSRAGLPVPPGFIITTRACAEYVATGKLPAGVTEAVRAQVATLEQKTERTFGGGPVPLLVSVRSGAPVSMPGMMETILNLGIGRDAAVALAEATGEPEFVLDVTRRLQKGFSEVVLGADPDVVDGAVANFALRADGTPFAETFDRYWARCRQAVEDDVGAAVPEDPWAQLQAAVMAVLRSWNSRRAITYREHHDISHDMGTAVVVQSMVFGNLGSPSGAGVAFTRNPVTGERALYGEFLERGPGGGRGRRRCGPGDDRRGRRANPGDLRRARPDLPRTSSSLTATRWTSSTPWNAASCTCCRCAAPSGRRRRRSGSPPTCSGTGGSGPQPPSPGCPPTTCAGSSGRASIRPTSRRREP